MRMMPPDSLLVRSGSGTGRLKGAERRRAIKACNRCAEACERFAIMWLQVVAGGGVTLCFQNAMDCAFVCRVVAACLSDNGEDAGKACGWCALLCRLTAREGGKDMALHCRALAVACEACALECEHIARIQRDGGPGSAIG